MDFAYNPSTKTECDCLNRWIKAMVTYAKISPRMVNPRDIAGNAKEEEEEECNRDHGIKQKQFSVK